MVIHFLPMRPCFHQPRRDGRSRAHTRTCPFKAHSRVNLLKPCRHFGVKCAPCFQELTPCQTVNPFAFKDFETAALHIIHHIGDKLHEVFFVHIGFISRPIPHVKMLKNIVQRPALKLGRRSEIIFSKVFHYGVERVRLGHKIARFIQHRSLYSSFAAIVIMRSSAPTCWSISINRSSTEPSISARISCCIFIASIIASRSPF